MQEVWTLWCPETDTFPAPGQELTFWGAQTIKSGYNIDGWLGGDKVSKRKGRSRAWSGLMSEGGTERVAGEKGTGRGGGAGVGLGLVGCRLILG